MHVDLTQAPGEVSDFTCCELYECVQNLKKHFSTFHVRILLKYM